MLYPIGIQNFEDLRRNEYVYVDKTHHIHRLATTGKYYFLSRPRRFGKSLLMSTMEAYFKGKKELFKGLAMEQLEKDWTEYPVLHLDMNGSKYMYPEDLVAVLTRHLDCWEREYDIATRYSDLESRFVDVINAACKKTGRQVVILIDEYDKPIVNNFDKKELSDYYRAVLQGFYGVIKSMGEQTKFCLLTGVSKIGKLSVFSTLNNLTDISMETEYSDICGISENDLHKYFDESIAELAAANRLSIDGCYGKLRDMYDGYHFSEDADGMYNPFSILNTLRSKKFKDYWFETGTPTLLVNVMKQTSFDVTTLSDNVVVAAEYLNGMQDIVNRPVPLFFQTGYLTIKDYDPEFNEYTLGFPNVEVKNGFLMFIYSYYVPVNPAEGNTTTSKLARALRAGDPSLFMSILESLFANTTYQIQGDSEKNFQYAMYIIMELLGEYVQAERSTSNGRIDLLLQTKDYIYIIELKIDNTAEAALQQIEDKGYAKPFVNDPRKLKIPVFIYFRGGCNYAFYIKVGFMKERRFKKGIVNHVYQRTIGRFNIFYDLADYLVYYTIFCTFARQAEVIIWGLCIMIDHIHSLIQADSVRELSGFVSRTTSVFARVYNKERKRCGPLFEERFGSAPKADLKRLISCIIYLANNPVERRICVRAEEYRWNFIAYIGSACPFSEKFYVKGLSKRLKRALKNVDWHALNNKYLTYPVIDALYRGLENREKKILTDYIIVRYNVIDYEKVMCHFDSYDQLLTAIHSTTGSEYDLNEDKDRFSDGVYRDFIRILKQMGIKDIRNVIMLDDDTKFDIAKNLLRASNSHLRQVYKFLHIVHGSA